jgi:hypothetical protein
MSLKKGLTWIFPTVFSLMSGVANAASVTFDFSGEVTYGGSLSTIGSPVTGSFSYDTNAAPSISFGNFANYSFSAPFGISAAVNGHTVEASLLSVTVVNNFGGNVEDTFEVDASQLFVDGVSYPNGSFGFVLASEPGHTGVFSSTALPSSLNVAAFDAGPSLNYGFLQRDGGPTGTLLQFSVNSITSNSPVPEPSSFALTALGLLLISGAYYRKTNAPDMC